MASTGVVVRTLVGVFGCVGLSAFVYVYMMDCYSSCFDIHNRWLMAAYLPLFINLGVVAKHLILVRQGGFFFLITRGSYSYHLTRFKTVRGNPKRTISLVGSLVAILTAWVFYKESSWIVATLITLSLAVFTSITASAYIIRQFLKLSPEEFSKDPLYFVLIKHHKRDDTRHTKGPSVVAVEMIFSSIACLLLGTFIYVFIVDGSPFHAKVFSPCMVGTLIDFYATTAILAVWITYKESTWISALFWILLLLCFGSITICVYIVLQLFHLSPQQPAFLVIFNRNHRDLLSKDPLLVRDADVQV